MGSKVSISEKKVCVKRMCRSLSHVSTIYLEGAMTISMFWRVVVHFEQINPISKEIKGLILGFKYNKNNSKEREKKEMNQQVFHPAVDKRSIAT